MDDGQAGPRHARQNDGPEATQFPYNPGAGYDTGQLKTFNGLTFGGAPFSQKKTCRLLDILDGASNTLLAAEVIQGQKDDLRGFTWWGHGAIFVGYIGPNSRRPTCCIVAPATIAIPRLPTRPVSPRPPRPTLP